MNSENWFCFAHKVVFARFICPFKIKLAVKLAVVGPQLVPSVNKKEICEFCEEGPLVLTSV